MSLSFLSLSLVAGQIFEYLVTNFGSRLFFTHLGLMFVSLPLSFKFFICFLLYLYIEIPSHVLVLCMCRSLDLILSFFFVLDDFFLLFLLLILFVFEICFSDVSRRDDREREKENEQKRRLFEYLEYSFLVLFVFVI